MHRFLVVGLLTAALFAVGCSSSDDTTPAVPITITAPDGLAASAQSPNTIQLTWNDNGNDEDGFKISRARFGENVWAVIATTAPSVETIIDTGLVEGTVYSYYVRAFDGANLSESTDTVNAGTQLVSPVDLLAEPQSVMSMIVAWTDASNAEEGYRIERKTGNGRFAVVANVDADITSHIDSNLIANTQYTYRIRAVKDSLLSAWSDEAVGQTFKFPPNAPVQLRAQRTDVTTILVSWRDNSQDEDGFSLERALIDNPDWQVIATLSANTAAFSDTGLVEGTTYQYRVTSFIGGSHSSYTGPVSISTSLFPPVNLTAARDSETSISIAWQDGSTAELGYQVSRALGLNPFENLSEVLPAGTQAFLDTDLTRDMTYRYRVRAVRDTINSNWSNEASAHTTLRTPVPPTNLTASGSFDWINQAHIEWTDNSSGERNERGFIVEISPNGADSWEVRDTVDADITTATVSDLPSETTWHFRVSSFNEYGLSTYSNSASCVIFGLPASPTDLTAESTPGAPGVAILRWVDNSSSESGFIIDISENGTDWLVQDTINPDLHVWSVRNLPVESTWHFRLKAYNPAGNSAYTNAVSTMIVGLPPAPTNLTGSAPNYRVVVLDWQDNSMSEQGFYVERREAANYVWRLVNTAAPDVIHASDSTVTPDRGYVYRVRAYNASGQSESTNEVNIQVPPSPPITPTNLSVTAIDIDQIEVGWYDRATNEDNYFVERRGPDDEEFRMVAALDPNTNFFLDTNLLPETWYIYRVYALNRAGMSDYTPTDSAQTQSLLLYTENFEGMAADNPPEGWNLNVAGSSWARVTTTRPHQGDKSLNFHDPEEGANHAWAYKSHTPLARGTITAWLFIPDSSWFSFHGADAGFTTYTFRFFFMDNDSFSVLDGGAMVVHGTYPTDRWFKIDVEFNSDSTHYVVFFDDEQVTGECVLPGSAPNGHVAGLAFSDTEVTDAFIDDITVIRYWQGQERNYSPIPKGRPFANSPTLIRQGNEQFRMGVRTGVFK